jgi:hypothetical protein
MSLVDKNSSIKFEISVKDYHMINAGVMQCNLNSNIASIVCLTKDNINSVSGQTFTTEQSQKWLLDNQYMKIG